MLREDLLSISVLTCIGFYLRYRFLTHDVGIDEAASYILYAPRPLFSVFSMYTLPNNHILNTVLMKFSTQLFGLSAEAIRLPAFFFGVALIPISYFFSFLLYRKKSTAALTTAFVVLSPYLVEYSINGRGYSLQAFLFLVAWCFALHFRRTANLISALWMGLFLGIGFVVIPTMLFAYVTIFFFSTGLTALVGLIGYAPAILFVGSSMITNNTFVVPQSWTSFFYELPQFLRLVFESWNGSSLFVAWLLGLGVIVSAFSHRKREQVKYFWPGQWFCYSNIEFLLFVCL